MGLNNTTPSVVLQAGDIEIGAVELKDSATDSRASIEAANTARTTATKVVATQNVDAAGKVHNVGTGVMAVSKPVTIATDDTMMTALDTAVDKVVTAVEIMDDWDDGDRCKVALPATTGFSVDQSAALEASSETKASAGRLYKVFGRIDSTLASGTYYIQLLDSAALPADGAVTHLVAPIKIIHVAGTDSFFELDLTGNNSYSGVAATSGIVIVSSSTEFTKTITAASFSASVLFV